MLLINSDFHSHPEFADEASRHRVYRLPCRSSVLTDSAGPSQRDKNFSVKPETTCDREHKTEKRNHSVHGVISQPHGLHKGEKKNNELCQRRPPSDLNSSFKLALLGFCTQQPDCSVHAGRYKYAEESMSVIFGYGPVSPSPKGMMSTDCELINFMYSNQKTNKQTNQKR